MPNTRSHHGVVCALALLGLLGGCADTTPDYRQNNPIVVSAQPFNLVITAPGPDGRLDPADTARLEGFVDTYFKRGDGPVIVALEASPEDATSQARALAISNALMAQGLRGQDVDVRLSAPPPPKEGEAPLESKGVLITFTGFVAEAPECGDWEENIAMESWNGSRQDFGCANQRNLGLMVSNPRDLIQMRTVQGRFGSQGARVISAYRAGTDPRSQPTVSGAVATQALGAQ